MPVIRLAFRSSLRPGAALCVLAAALAGCAVGPDFHAPAAPHPDDWTRWRSGDASLIAQTGAADAALPAEWWRAFGDPVLDRLQERAVAASPDLRTAALRFAQARAQRDATAAQRGPTVDLNGGMTRQRQSEYAAGTRMLDAVGGGANRDELAEFLAEPHTVRQAGFDASWELDLWGRIRRSIEAADADVARQAALLDLARLSLASELARHYFELRTTQDQARLTREDVAALQERVALLEAQTRSGLIDHLALEQQRTELSATEARLPELLAQESASANRIALLLGEHPGALRDTLQPLAPAAHAALPDLALGVPSEVARRRPDIRAAEARLRNATASIGIAQAELYPSIRLGARFGYESYLGGEFAEWGSRAWSIGPSLSLPVFDHGRRKSVVQLRELQQQEAAVAYQQTVLQAWQEIDDALSGYTAERQRHEALTRRAASARQAHELARARYDGGAADFIAVLDSQRSHLLARRELSASRGRLNTAFVAVNKALGNGPGDQFAFRPRSSTTLPSRV